jgi:hypothetical protein
LVEKLAMEIEGGFKEFGVDVGGVYGPVVGEEYGEEGDRDVSYSSK